MRVFLPALMVAASVSAAIAQQPIQPLPKVGGCPLGYYSSGSYCVPSKSGNTLVRLRKQAIAARWASTARVTTASAARATTEKRSRSRGRPARWDGSAPAATASRIADGRTLYRPIQVTPYGHDNPSRPRRRESADCQAIFKCANEQSANTLSCQSAAACSAGCLCNSRIKNPGCFLAIRFVSAM